MQSRLINPVFPGKTLRIFLIRKGHGGVVAERPPPSIIQFKAPQNEKGHLHYDRDWSTDHRYSKPIIDGCTFKRFIF
jgi:hypothetical protein